MAWTSDDLTALETAIKGGVKRVKYSDREIEYNSLREMLELRDLMRKELGTVTGGPYRKKAQFSKGL